MDNSKTLFEKERREIKSKLVTIKFMPTGKLFQVLDEKGIIKYNGCLDLDMCMCKSYEFGNTPEYEAAHGTKFQCKHLIQAHEQYTFEKKRRERVEID